ncbi:hypothetical protein ACXU4B_15795 [Dyella soli]|uniref:Porin n=1 Tax=Dyella soli TaxID=522319 RepID=A0A4R0YK59_9GAMM|nr:hypothetical protein [Dyella soli]TCI08899.1 hypothetical protein EZM97_21880 [Dyella soli]
MLKRRLPWAGLVALALAGPVLAQDASLHAYIDARLVSAPDQPSWTQGGVGKARYGRGDNGLQFGGGAVVGTIQATPSLLLYADIQYQTTDRSTLSVVEAYLRYRPVSTGAWRGSLKLGVFLPPVSLENDAIGWTSPWTITPSAINSWAGEELRAKGLQGELEWRGERQTLAFGGSLFKGNDPTGTLLDVRGWSLSDLTSGLGSKLREPDSYLQAFGDPDRPRYDPFQEIDGRWGWYANLAWRSPEHGQLTLMRYDNRGDPAAHTTYDGSADVFAWRTYFWSAGARTDTGPVTWIAQAMDGTTEIDPFTGLRLETRFRSAFLLAGWNRGAWRPALRFDHFSTGEYRNGASEHQGESGNAITAALNWRPRPWLRLTGEVLHIEGTRSVLQAFGLPTRFNDTQLQLNARLIY